MEHRPPLADSDIIDGLSVWYLKFFGFLKIINDYRTTRKRSAFLKCKFILIFLICFPYIACQYLSYFVIEMDIQKATIINLHCLPIVMMCSRMLMFWFHMDSQCKLFNLIRNDFLRISKNKMAESKNICMKITKDSNTLCMLPFILDFSVVLTTVGIPGIPVDYILYHTGSMFDVTTGRKKILSGWYPLPMADSPYYEIIFVYEAIFTLLGGVFLPIYVCLFYQVLVGLHVQFVALGHHVSTLNINSNSGQRKKFNNYREAGICEEMYKILQDHQRLLRYADELRSVYNPLVTMTLGIATAFLIVSVFQYHMRDAGDLMFVIKAIQFLLSQVAELFMFCYGSSSIEAASSDLQFAVYSSDWYKADVKFRKAAQMMMVRSKKGVTLTAVKMYPVNLETLMSIIQFTYSTSALMSGLLEK